MPEGLGATALADWSGAVPLKGVAHSAQNFAAGGFSKPHRVQERLNGVAHSIQNLAPSGFSAEQFWQRMVTGGSNPFGQTCITWPQGGTSKPRDRFPYRLTAEGRVRVVEGG